jgi:WD40 repeat protein
MDPVIEFWDLNDANPVEPYFEFRGQNGHTGSITSLQLHETRQNILLSGSQDRTVKVWDIQKQSCLLTHTDFQQTVTNVKWSPQNDSLALVLQEASRFKLFDVRNKQGEVNTQFDFQVENFCVSKQNGDIVLLACKDGHIRVYDLKMNKVMGDVKVKAHNKEITCLQSNTQGQIVSNGLDGLIKIFDKDLKEVKKMDTKVEVLFGSDLSRDNEQLFACGSGVGEVVIWNYGL